MAGYRSAEGLFKLPRRHRRWVSPPQYFTCRGPRGWPLRAGQDTRAILSDSIGQSGFDRPGFILSDDGRMSCRMSRVDMAHNLPGVVDLSTWKPTRSRHWEVVQTSRGAGRRLHFREIPHRLPKLRGRIHRPTMKLFEVCESLAGLLLDQLAKGSDQRNRAVALRRQRKCVHETNRSRFPRPPSGAILMIQRAPMFSKRTGGPHARPAKPPSRKGVWFVRETLRRRRRRVVLSIASESLACLDPERPRIAK